MFTSIVVGTDGSARSQQAVAAAAELARVHGAALHLVQAYRPSMATLSAVGVAGDAMVAIASSTDDELHGEVDKRLRLLADELSKEGVSVTTHASPQSAAPAILTVAEEQKADLVIVGSKGMQGARRVLGSVPNSIAHQAPCAVMIVPTGG